MNLKAKQNKKKTMKVGLISLATAAIFLTPKLVDADSYTVKSGDTLSAIAHTHGTTVSEIAQKNNISNINFISIGQILEINTPNAEQKAPEATNPVATNPETSVESSIASETTNASSGLSSEEAEAKEWIAQKESGGSYTAQNGQYYGRYQLTISYLNGDLSAENQEKVANAYVTERYGSWSAAKNFWLANGWY